MKKFPIERDVAAVGNPEREQRRAGAQKSNDVPRELGSDIRWVHSHLAADKLFCFYLAKDGTLIQEHARRSGLPGTANSALE